MTALEIALIVMGLVFILGSYMVAEKLSGKELKQVAELSSDEISKMIDKELLNADEKISDTVDRVIEESVMKVERMMDKETNGKIMAISEYSDSVLDSISKTHNEVMFLYGMLNDKHEELTNLAGKVSEIQEKIFTFSNELSEKMESAASAQAEAEAIKIEEQLAGEAYQKTLDLREEQLGNHNSKILELYRSGMDQIQIARNLGVGLGEVRLVIDLFRGEN